ncbi:MAG TPA: hypothetical protein VK689_18675 [Armatimonadota bacterium]|nr:hypothetical protein [Armatimonadota bacterium]
MATMIVWDDSDPIKPRQSQAVRAHLAALAAVAMALLAFQWRRLLRQPDPPSDYPLRPGELPVYLVDQLQRARLAGAQAHSKPPSHREQ